MGMTDQNKSKTTCGNSASPAESGTPKGKGRRRAPAKGRRSAARTLPILPLHDAVLFPFTMISLSLESEHGIKLLDDALKGDRLIALLPARADEEQPRDEEDFYPVGCSGRIVKTLRFPDESRRVLVRGLQRVRLERLTQIEPYAIGKMREIEAPEDNSLETEGLAAAAQTQFQNLVSLSPHFPEELKIVAYNIQDKGRLADMVADTIGIDFAEKLAVLSTVSLRERLELILGFLSREEVVLQVGSEIQSQVNAQFAKTQREHFLREQLKAIQEQLGEEAETPDIAELRKRIDIADMSEEAREAAVAELKRLRQMHPAQGDYNVGRNYIEWLISLPWTTLSEDALKIGKAERILDRDHYDLKKVKERILEYLAVLQLKDDMRAPILCFVGPPGVGKTSLGRSIADALNRKFVRMSLGGVRDEAEIRGHRRTYVGALPGRIAQGIKRAGTRNPVFMLDEIDKLGTDFRGDPASALLEVLDPEQNNAFSDHYLEIPLDLSAVLFITTANLVDPIPPALRDRMEIIRIPGYTQDEKCEIARRFLVPRQLDENGLSKSQLTFYKLGLQAIVDTYTFEAGVRNLEREIAAVCRKHARRIIEARVNVEERIAITPKNVADYLGPPRLFPDVIETRAHVGLCTGLAWTAAGGQILKIEANSVPGNGKLVLTGSLGDVMKESAQIAYTFVKSNHLDIGFDPTTLNDLDIHVHVPAGATPKDGPSAGIAIAVAIASLLSRRSVKPYHAMTGEISLRGHLLPVGGIKEKVLAAARAGARTVILPAKNRNEAEDDIPREIRDAIDFTYLGDAKAVLKLTLEKREIVQD